MIIRKKILVAASILVALGLGAYWQYKLNSHSKLYGTEIVFEGLPIPEGMILSTERFKNTGDILFIGNPPSRVKAISFSLFEGDGVDNYSDSLKTFYETNLVATNICKDVYRFSDSHDLRTHIYLTRDFYSMVTAHRESKIFNEMETYLCDEKN